MHVSVTLMPIASQKVDFTNVNAKSTALGPGTFDVRLIASQDCWVMFGPTALAVATTDGTSMFLKAGQAEYFHIENGSLIGVIQDSAPGSLYISEMSR